MSDTPADPRDPLRFASQVAAPGVQPGERLAHAARAAEDLSAALWEALHEELRAPHAQHVAELSERLAQVCSALALLAARAGAEGAGSQSPPRAPSAPERSTAAFAPAVAAPPPEFEFGLEPELEPEIAIRDARRDGAEAWARTIGDSLERYVRDGLPFAVLLVEVLDVERLAHAESPPEIDRLLALVESALGRELRPLDSVTRESPGRWWLIAPQVDARGVRQLAQRLARSVSAAASHRGVGLEVAIGTALCPEDGRDAATLAAHADIGLYAARASGQSLPPEDAA